MDHNVEKDVLVYATTQYKEPELINRQEKRYRSMQEHIRRAHPPYYIRMQQLNTNMYQI